ncbi:hypothetical protein WJX74_005191 [Apatococcus lobatus]|uniref:Carboxypeptidase n=1 Tax=Apatococcus lobatus TaxID=904363 RepID=A0AAW1R2V5_9CHLO
MSMISVTSERVGVDDKPNEAERDRVRSLPGWGPVDFGLYGGYINVDKEAGRHLYYAFAESLDSPSHDPLVLWVNGGPGCSSMAGGFLSELGPFYATKGNNLQRNEYAWNRVANVLFLDSPAFVGWSYSEDAEDRIVGDARTAKDTRNFILGFLERFPQYIDRPLWLAGESYGGHYVPNTALEIVAGNARADEKQINLVGFLVGNGLADVRLDNLGALEYWASHAIISYETKDKAIEACNLSTTGPFQAVPELTDNSACNSIVKEASTQMGPINIYQIYADTCRPAISNQAHEMSRHGGPQLLGSAVAAHGIQQYDPCIDDECSPYIRYSQSDLLKSMLPTWKKLLQEKLHILVYSGDMDGILPTLGTMKWIEALKLDLVEPFQAWLAPNGQTGGHLIKYKGLTFASVRGAGHMVPYTQPQRAYYMFEKYLKQQEL